MTPLVRYQAALLLRSQRWIVPVLVYAAALASGSNGGEPLGDALAWSAAMVVPAAAWLTRCSLTNEPAAARACLAAAGGARRAHLSALVVAALGAVLLVAAGSVFEILVSGASKGGPGTSAVTSAGVMAGLAAAFTGVAIGALCNPPLIARRGSDWTREATSGRDRTPQDGHGGPGGSRALPAGRMRRLRLEGRRPGCSWIENGRRSCPLREHGGRRLVNAARSLGTADNPNVRSCHRTGRLASEQ